MTAPTRQSIDWEVATRIVDEAEAAFGQIDIKRMLAGFTPDVVIRFGDVPEVRGLEAADEFLRARYARFNDYQLKKTLRTVTGNVIEVTLESEWEDAGTGKRMQGRGVEFLTIRDGKIALWEGASNAWEEDDTSAGPSRAS